MSLLFNMLSRFVIAFPSKVQASFNFMAVVTVCSDFGAQENKICHFFHFSPFYLPWSNGTWCHDLSFLNAEFQASFFILLFYPLGNGGSSVPLHFLPLEWYHVHVWGCWYCFPPSPLHLPTSLPPLIPACDLSSPAFCMIYSAYKLNKQGDNIQPCHNSFSNLEPVHCSMSSSNCCFLTYIPVSQETGKVVWYSHLVKNFLQFVVIHAVKALV